MIDELKLLIEALGNASEIGLWVLGGFVSYKTIIYLSTTGAIVFLCRLGIERLHDYLKNRPMPPAPNIELKYDKHALGALDRILINGEAQHLLAVLCRIRRHSEYIHSSDIDWLEEAIEEKNAKDNSRRG